MAFKYEIGVVVGMVAVYDHEKGTWFYFKVIPSGRESFGYTHCRYIKDDGSEAYETGDRGICTIYETQITAHLESYEDGEEWLYIETCDVIED